MSKNCFIICPIGREGSETRQWSDRVNNEILYPILSKYEFIPFRSDHIQRPGIIHNQIIDEIIDSPLVIADLTYNNANVFYELSIRHAVAKPILQIIRNTDNIPFDIGPIRVIKIDFRDLHTSIRNFENMLLESQKEEIMWDNPISMALNTRNIRLDPAFNEKDIIIQFKGYNSSEISLQICDLSNLPSSQAKIRLQEEIENLKSDFSNKVIGEPKNVSDVNDFQKTVDMFDLGSDLLSSPFAFTSKEDYRLISVENLQKQIDTVTKDYYVDDIYEISEKRSHKISLEIMNNFDRHLEDVDIFLNIPKEDGFIIPRNIAKKPQRGLYDLPSLKNPFSPKYPIVEYENSKVKVSSHLDKIKHFQITNVFELELRIVVTNKILTDLILIECDIHAKNLVKPIKKILSVKIEKKEN